MSTYNRAGARRTPASPVKTETQPSGRTALGAPGYARDLKSELFLLAATNLPGEKTFHEGTDIRVARFRHLVRQAAVADPVWTAGLLGWLRGPGNLRLAPVIAAAEFAWARRDNRFAPQPRDPSGYPRAVVSSVLQRADEPGELAAYWLSQGYGLMPIGLKRGLADAMGRWDEFGLLKYDTPEAAIRFGDLVELVNPRYHLGCYGTWREALFCHAIDRRHGRGRDIPVTLPKIMARRDLMRLPVTSRREFIRLGGPDVTPTLRDAGMTWEAMAGWLQAPMDAAAWRAIIPLMGVGALVKNLRNFDRAGVDDRTAAKVAEKLTDPGQIERSRLFPYRFLAAYRATEGSMHWGWPLEQALRHSLARVPELDGHTLVLVDRSPSMWMQKFSEHSDMVWADAAAVFGAAIALRCRRADLAEFWGNSRPVPFRHGDSVLNLVKRFSHQPAPGGTDIPAAVRANLRPAHTRVVIVTDEQTRAGWLPSNMRYHGGSDDTPIDQLIPAEVPVYMWNFGGYVRGATPSGSGNRHTVGGLSDSAFGVISMLEAHRDASWPWLAPGTMVA